MDFPRNVKGYDREEFLDPWERWLPGLPSGLQAKQRNSPHDARDGVSAVEGWTGADAAQIDLPLEHHYPGSTAWVADTDDDLAPDQMMLPASVDHRRRERK